VIREIAVASLRHRRGTFAAAFIAVGLGSLAVTATASALAASFGTGGHPLVDGGSPLLVAQNMAGQSTGLVVCTVAVVVAAAFTVMAEQRRRELALMSLVGALPRQLRRLVLTEALLLAAVAAAAGCAAGTLAAGQFGRWMDAHQLAPAWFRVGFSGPAVLVAFAVTVTMAVLGAAVVATRASFVRPAEALRAAAEDRRPVTWIRWLLGLSLLAAAVTAAWMIAGTSALDAVNPRKYAAVPVLFTGGFALLVPLLARPAAGVLAVVSRLARRPGLVAARLRRASHSAAAAAFPIALATGLAGTLLLTAAAADAARITRLRDETAAAFVVQPGPRRPLPVISAVPGATIGTVTPVPVSIATASGQPLDHLDGQAVNAGVLGRSLTPSVLAGSLARLGADWIVIDQHTAQSDDIALGQRLRVSAPGQAPAVLTVRAIIASGLSSDDTYLPDEAADGQPQIGYVRLTQGARPGRVQAELTAAYAASGASIESASAYFAAQQSRLAAQDSTAAPVIIGIAVLYCLIAVVNTLVMTTLGRRREFAALSLAGLTRRQVVGSAAAEAALATLLGAIPAGLAMLATLACQRAALRQLVSAVPVPVPWPDIGAVALVCLLVAVGAGVLATVRLTATPAIELAALRD
jgi:putative ABC transport system permease protein